MIPLSIGDPTVFGNLRAPEVLIEAIQAAAADAATHGYKHSAGMDTARAAVAKRHSAIAGRTVAPSDVVLTSGCSGALDIAIKALCSEGDELLVPRPGFALYETLAKSNGADVKYYDLVPDRSWEADLEHLEKCIGGKTRAILVNNPSNPCGSVYSQEHLNAILAIAEKHGLPIIADEIYGNITFDGHKFHALASLTKTVPILEVGGIAKEFLVPGFRIGWIILHDAPARSNEDGSKRMALEAVWAGVAKLTQLLVGPNTIVQAALPRVLTPEAGSEDETRMAEFHKKTLAELEGNAKFLVERLDKIRGIRTIVPQGAMYVMIGFDKSAIPADKAANLDGFQFTQKLLNEELVFLLPGKCFEVNDFMRIVFCAPKTILADACDRIERFCAKEFGA
mmetsp:Transcript_18060/g.57726  ORF Transcript_18060/g.57726 Transcript_18060/m.57726 type:complete len:395 (+) Transcript_18060:354-1538(+)